MNLFWLRSEVYMKGLSMAQPPTPSSPLPTSTKRTEARLLLLQASGLVQGGLLGL